MKLTERQDEVLKDIALVRTDGARVDPQFRLGDRNVTTQVRSLLRYGLIQQQGTRLMAAEKASAPHPAAVDTSAAVSEMRDLLGGGDGATGDNRSTTKGRSPSIQQ